MDCRQFRKQHTYFVDDMLSGVETWAMRDHVGTCQSCAKFDSQLRRSLFLARQARTIEPSEDFQRKLSARLAEERLARPNFDQPAPTVTKRAPFIAAAAAVLAVGIAGIHVARPSVSEPIALAPVVVPAPAQVAAVEPVSLLNAESLASQPIHPAILLAQRATEQFIATQAPTSAVRVTH